MGAPDGDHTTFIKGKDLPLEQTIANMTQILADSYENRDRFLA